LTYLAIGTALFLPVSRTSDDELAARHRGQFADLNIDRLKPVGQSLAVEPSGTYFAVFRTSTWPWVIRSRLVALSTAQKLEEAARVELAAWDPLEGTRRWGMREHWRS